MDIQNGKDQDKILTDQQLDKVIRTLLDIENMNDRPLYFKVKGEIAARRARRRKRSILISSCAASAAVILISAAVWLSGPKEEPVLLADQTGVKLIVSDGRSYNLSEDKTESLVTDDNVILTAEEGTLFVESASVETPTAAPTFSTLDVPRGMQFDIVLNDGTKVWLNSDTRLRFPTRFTGSTRTVYIEGEAYFEVANDASKPFVVEMGAHSVTVLGTSFNINAYEYKSATLTTLFSGSLKVSSDLTGSESILVPGQQASIDKATGTIGVRNINLVDEIAWRKNIINLEKRTLEEITSYMAKIYNVSFRFMDDSARTVRFRGDVTRSEDIHSVLDRLGEVGNVRFEEKGNEIEIYIK